MGGITLGIEAVKFGGSFDGAGDSVAGDLTDDSGSVLEGTQRAFRRDANILSLILQAPRSDDWTELSMAGACECSGATAFAVVRLAAPEKDMDGMGFARCSCELSMPVGKGNVLTPNEVVRVVRRLGVFT